MALFCGSFGCARFGTPYRPSGQAGGGSGGDGAVRRIWTGRWAASRQEPGGALILDGKAAPERTEGPNPERVLIAAMAHGSGLTLGQTASDSAGGEILDARRLLDWDSAAELLRYPTPTRRTDHASGRTKSHQVIMQFAVAS